MLATGAVLAGAPLLGQLAYAPSPALAVSSTGDPVIGAVGDMACDTSDPAYIQSLGAGIASNCAEQRTSNAMLADPLIDTVLGLGDYQYDCGDLTDYEASYNPTWGRLDPKMDPVAGNHEYKTGNDVYGRACPTTNTTAANYFAHFMPYNDSAHQTTTGHYSFDLGDWHIIALNGNCRRAGGCSATSTQTTWLKKDLAADARPCTLAYWHQPLFTGLAKGIAKAYRPWWNALYAAHADVVLNGHIHNYQRYAPLSPTGAPDPTGLTEYVVGTGGEKQVAVAANSVPHPVTNDKTFGYLRMALSAGSWTAEFVDTNGAVLDTSTGVCHRAVTS